MTERSMTGAEVVAMANALGLDPAYVAYQTAKVLTYPDGHMAAGFWVAAEVDPAYFGGGGE